MTGLYPLRRVTGRGQVYADRRSGRFQPFKRGVVPAPRQIFWNEKQRLVELRIVLGRPDKTVGRVEQNLEPLVSGKWKSAQQ